MNTASTNTEAMNTANQKLCVWCGIAFMGIFAVGFAIAGFIPPAPSPNQSAHEMAQLFRDNPTSIRIGLLLTMFASAFYAPWCVVIGVQLRRIEGRFAVLSGAQTVLGTLFVLEFIIPMMILQSAAYRPERTDEAIQSLIDTAWLMFMGVGSTLLLQGILIGVAILQDIRSEPIFPRWSGYFSMVGVLMTEPASFVVFVKGQPFAWNGILAWWVAVVAFTAWLLVFTWLTWKAVHRQSRERSAEPDGFATAAELAELRAELRHYTSSAEHVT